MGRKYEKLKCLVLLSGGLDSRLVCRLMQDQLGKEGVEAVFFMLPFGGRCCSDKFCVFRFAQSAGLKLHIVNCEKGALFRKYIKIINNPRFGRGTAMNPCVDCHLFMLKEAGKLAKKIGADVVATGEVLGQRPMSQQMRELLLIEKEAGLTGRLLRPLSAKLLPETAAEKAGTINREKLLAISGRQRKVQIELAKEYGMDFPSPGGGCLLTEKQLEGRIRKVLQLFPGPEPEAIQLISLGRHFSPRESLVIVGRREEENVKLMAIAKKLRLTWMEVSGHVGPVTVIAGKTPKALVKTAAELTVRYSDAPDGDWAVVVYAKGQKSGRMKVKAAEQAVSESLIIR